MRISDLATKDGKTKGNKHHAVTERPATGKTATIRDIYHYSTLMLSYTVVEGVWDGNLDSVYVSTGNGSKTDQDCMNQWFKALGMPLRFDRAGGAQIVQLVPNPNYIEYDSGSMYSNYSEYKARTKPAERDKYNRIPFGAFA